MPETVLDLITRVHVEPLLTGMADAAKAPASASATMVSEFAKLAAGSETSFGKIEAELVELKAGMTQLQTSVAGSLHPFRKVSLVQTRYSGFCYLRLLDWRSRGPRQPDRRRR